jgi:uncharacterized protein YndB with AHSA1/START domain
MRPTGNENDRRISGSLHQAEGAGVVRREGLLMASPDELWSALTDPRQLALWLGEVSGELQLGGRLNARFTASGWEGTAIVEACEPSRRFRISTRSDGEPDGVMEVTLTPTDDGTLLVFEDRGMPLAQIAAYGAGDQIHVEDLAAYLAGGASADARVRWSELHPAYEALAQTIE